MKAWNDRAAQETALQQKSQFFDDARTLIQNKNNQQQ